MSVDNSVSEHIFSLNGGFCLYINKQIIPVSIGVPLTCRGSIYSPKNTIETKSSPRVAEIMKSLPLL